MAGRKILVKITGEDNTSRATSSAEKNFGRLGKRLDGVAKAFAGLYVAEKAGEFIKSAGEAAIEDEHSQERLATALHNSAGASDAQVAATERWITAQQFASGVSDSTLRPALAALTRATGDVGRAQHLTTLAMDVSAGTGKGLSAVSMALAKAYNGNVGALGRLGIKTKDAHGKALSFKQVQAELAEQFKGASAKAADTTEGKMHRLGERYAELKEGIGTKLLPVLTRLTDWGIKALDWMGKHPKLVTVLATAIGVLAVALGIATVVQWALNAAMLASPITWIIVAIVALVAIIVLLVLHFKDLKKWGADAWNWIKAKAIDAWNWIRGKWGAFVGWMSGIWSSVKHAGAAAWDWIKSKAGAAKDWVVGKWNAFIGFFTGLPGRIGSIASRMWDGMKSAFRSAINWVIDRWNSLHFTIPSFSAFGHHFGGGTIGVPSIPHMAQGGVVKAQPGGIIANVGEGKYDEAVVPLSPQNLAAMSGAGGGVNIQISGFVGNAQEVGREIERVLTKFLQSQGRKPTFT